MGGWWPLDWPSSTGTAIFVKIGVVVFDSGSRFDWSRCEGEDGHSRVLCRRLMQDIYLTAFGSGCHGQSLESLGSPVTSAARENVDDAGDEGIHYLESVSMAQSGNVRL